MNPAVRPPVPPLPFPPPRVLAPPGVPLPGVPLPGVSLPGVPLPVGPGAAVTVVAGAGAVAGAGGAVAGAAVAGALTGALLRCGLGRLRRGVVVPPPWCECGLALLWAGAVAAWTFGPAPPWTVLLLLVLAVLLVAGSATDLLRRRLPNALTLPALPAVGLALVPAGGSALGRGTAGALLLGGAYAAVHLLAPAALGAGDVKLAAPVGAALAGTSWPVLVAGLAAAAAGSGLVAAGAVATGRAGWGSRFPHGPVLLGAAWVTALGSAFVP